MSGVIAEHDLMGVYSTLELCQYAAEKVKAAGFVPDYVSMKTEACYYRWPDRPHLLRIAAHAKSKQNGMTQVVASITFRGNHRHGWDQMAVTMQKVDLMIAQGIGRYFLKSQPETVDFSAARALIPDGLNWTVYSVYASGERPARVVIGYEAAEAETEEEAFLAALEKANPQP